MNLGTLLRRQRKEHKLTLRVVAERAGVSEGFLSQVENNVKTPSVTTLMHICDAVGSDAGALLKELRNQQRLHLVLRSEWEEVDLPHTGFATRRFCPPEQRSVIDSAMLFLEAGKSLPVRKNIKNGQEVLCVLSGELELVHGEERVRLAAGDAAHFWSEPQDQEVKNTGDELAVMIWVGTL